MYDVLHELRERDHIFTQVADESIYNPDRLELKVIIVEELVGLPFWAPVVLNVNIFESVSYIGVSNQASIFTDAEYVSDCLNLCVI